MDQDTQAYLEAILSKGPSGLTVADAAFLRARAEYLSEDQRVTYASVLSEAAPLTAGQTTEHVITQADLDANPGLENDVKVGDSVELPAAVKPLEAMNRNELRDIAATLNIEVSMFESNASIVEKIHAASAAQ